MNKITHIDKHQPANISQTDPEQLMSLLQNCAHLLHHRKGQQRGQSWVLSLLLAHSPISQRMLQDYSEMRSASLSELLCKLESSGLITRVRSDSDKRNMNILITDEGRQLAITMEQERKECADQLFNCLSEPEKQSFEALLAKLLCAWEQDSGESEHERIVREQQHGHYHRHG